MNPISPRRGRDSRRWRAFSRPSVIPSAATRTEPRMCPRTARRKARRVLDSAGSQD
jgi:hypothetical protein